MVDRIRILAVNPGSTSTKIALFDDDEQLFSASIAHPAEELRAFGDIQAQLDYRRGVVEAAMREHGHGMSGIDAFSGRGGGLLPVPGGVYEISELMVRHAAMCMTSPHPAQLASQICRQLADRYGGRAFVVNPPDTDELDDAARVTGLRGVYRESHVHALNQKEVALRFCKARGLRYEEVNLIVCHLGGGISVTAHRRGRMVDSNDIIMGSGPMTPTRAGDLPYRAVIDLAYSGAYTRAGLIDRLNRAGGLTDHFGTSDIREVYRLADAGDAYAGIILDGMAYQNAKYAGAMAAALKGEVNAIILTGGIAHRERFTDRMKEHLGWIAQVVVMPGELELEALAAGALRVMRGEEEAKAYTGVPVWNGFKNGGAI